MSSQPLLGARLRGSSGSLSSNAGGQGRSLASYAPWVWLVGPLVVGGLVGVLMPSQCGLPAPVDRFSAIIGWTYFACWSISFYPQVWINQRRKSVVGLSLDFQLLNLLGFGCYAIYNSALYWSPAVRQEYARHHRGDLPAIHRNDVFFSIHATLITVVTLVQCCVHDRGGQRLSPAAVLGVLGTAVVCAAYGAAVLLAPGILPPCPEGHGLGNCNPDSLLTWLNWLYFLSSIKMGVSLVKYIPQVMLNWRRRSTEGWNIYNVLLDLEGGALSLAQLLLDSIVTKDWSAVTGNPVKFGLGFTSIFFDIIFMMQHYWCFREVPEGELPMVWDGSPVESAVSGSAEKAVLQGYSLEASGSVNSERDLLLLPTPAEERLRRELA